MKHFALIGTPLAHSQSQTFFQQCVSPTVADYRLLELSSLDGLRDAVEEYQLDGFNVTIPYKRTILPLLDSIDADAAAIGAVNVVSVRRTPAGLHLHGANSDAPAFLQSLQPLLQPWHRSALILGTGGAAQAVAWALEKLGISHTLVSRSPRSNGGISYEEAVLKEENKEEAPLLLINATPVGMGASQGKSPWPRPELFTPRHLVYDLIYNPAQTQLLADAARQGASTKNGEEMLHRQALLSYRSWGI